MEAIDPRTAQAVGGGLTLAGLVAALALYGSLERAANQGGMFDDRDD